MNKISVVSFDGLSTYRFSERAILEVRDSTAGVDDRIGDGEFFTPEAHCDDELIEPCTRRILLTRQTNTNYIRYPC